ncbi:hypothetical protein [Accumulibacter sp.]|uniref:hypothetical protein n=1 Tax=Accumulibacter sp. TaxID=2053492 RepID=UPI0025FFEF78|nr:hypothetical protein [Accumulibacter sp.]MCM8594975.1 hypothetical protein [Accumulibacter sp.]MCM8627298.1 hypothetical protein [Accumulibacter sp.]MDS4049121.1 hypothetical protein [Accumulibacter sp.]
MSGFATTYRAIVLGKRLDVLARAYSLAVGEIDEDKRWIFEHENPEQREHAEGLARRAREEGGAFLRDAVRRRHQELVAQCLDPLARLWLGHHLFGRREVETLALLLADEGRRFEERTSDTLRGQASYAVRFAFRELDDLLSRLASVRKFVPGDQHDGARLPLIRHLIRELIVRADQAGCESDGPGSPDWAVVLEAVVARLASELEYRGEQTIPFAEFTPPEGDDDHHPSADDFPAETSAWAPCSQSVTSHYDRDDAGKIRCLIEHVAGQVAGPLPNAVEPQWRRQFQDRLRLRFACTAYTHLVRGLVTRIIERERMPAVGEALERARCACIDLGPAGFPELDTMLGELDGAVTACAVPFAALALRRLDSARRSLERVRRSKQQGKPSLAVIKRIAESLAEAGDAAVVSRVELEAFLLHAIEDCGIANEGDADCGGALAWLKTVDDTTLFGGTFDERLARERDAVAREIRASWDAALDQLLEDFLYAREACRESALRLSAADYLDALPLWSQPRSKWVEALTAREAAQILDAACSADEASLGARLELNLNAKRLDYKGLRDRMDGDPEAKQAWERISELRDRYRTLLVVARMRRNAPIRVFKYFTAICRLAENKGIDAETTMDLDEWLTTTERLFAPIEDGYLAAALDGRTTLPTVDEWNGELANPVAPALLPYYRLWDRLRVGLRPTSRAVPYLNAVRPALRPWFARPGNGSS